jgi:hypothetical protein
MRVLCVMHVPVEGPGAMAELSAEAMLEDTEWFTANTALLFRPLDGMEELA